MPRRANRNLNADEMREVLELAVAAHDEALARNREATAAGRTAPVGRGALMVLARRVETAREAIEGTTAA